MDETPTTPGIVLEELREIKKEIREIKRAVNGRGFWRGIWLAVKRAWGVLEVDVDKVYKNDDNNSRGYWWGRASYPSRFTNE